VTILLEKIILKERKNKMSIIHLHIFSVMIRVEARVKMA